MILNTVYYGYYYYCAQRAPPDMSCVNNNE